MANIQVSRQSLDEASNQLSWIIVTIDETELLSGEVPYEPLPEIGAAE